MNGKVVLITGGTGGIGLQIAIGLGRRGATIIVTGRDEPRGRAAVTEIGSQGDCKEVSLLLGDLSSQQEVVRISQELTARYDRLDVLVNNVGGLFGRQWETVDGVDGTLALNHLGPFLLTHLLLPILKASAPSRVININSEGHRASSGVDFDDLAAGRWRRGFQAYSQCKLANLMFTYALARRLEGSGVTVNAAHPGIADTQLVRRFLIEKLRLPPGRLSDALVAAATTVISRLYKFDCVQDAARCPIYLASSEEVETVSGKYFGSDGRIVASSPASYDQQSAERVWKDTEKLLRLQTAMSQRWD